MRLGDKDALNLSARDRALALTYNSDDRQTLFVEAPGLEGSRISRGAVTELPPSLTS